MNNHQQEQQQFQQNMQQTGSGLTRYRSAPSSYFASFLNDGGFGTEDLDQLFNPRASSPEPQRTYSRLSSNSDTIQLQENQRFTNSSAAQFQTGSSQLPPRNDKPPIQKQQRQQSNDYSSVSHMMYHSESANPVATDSSYSKFVSPMNSNSMMPMKMESGGGSGLIRHSSSPAGLFANIDIEKEFGALRNMGNFGAGNSSNTSRFNNQTDFSFRNASSSGMMAPISEIGSKGIRENNPGDGQFDEGHGNDRDFIPGFPMNSWDDDSVMLPDNFLAGIDDADIKPFSNDQSNEGGKPPRTMLSHHLSLPKSSAELSAVEKLLQDSVPCKIRAKRGCATHPRSIAERVRRTKISERMRKLQELVPNMDKQTNTSDMLDLAVDYIKDLQRQVKTLSDTRAKCTCSAKERL